MNEKLPVLMKCTKLGAVFTAEREVRITVSKRGMMEKEITKDRL